MHKIIAFVLLALVFSTPALAQESYPKSPFVSLSAGTFLPAIEGFRTTYGSPFAFALGGSYGYPLSSRTYLFVSTAYARATAVMPAYDITFTHWFFAAGGQYNIFLAEGYTLGFQGGVSANRITQTFDVTYQKVSPLIQDLELTRMGFFVGLVLEKNFGVKPVSVYFQPLYNYAPAAAFGGNQGGGFMTLGLRYYFGERRTL